MTIRVDCTTVYFRDGNSDKFYRAYVIDRMVLFQWGRRDTVGQFSAQRYTAPHSARLSATTKIDQKKAGGYGHEETFQFNLTLPPGSTLRGKEDGPTVDSARRSAERAAGRPATPPAPAGSPAPTTPIEAQLDRLARFNAEALTVMTLAVTDPRQAHEQYALLNQQWQELQDDLARARSYVATLDQLLMGVTT